MNGRRFANWVWAISISIAATSCERSPESYPMPTQRNAIAALDPPPAGSFVKFSDPDADAYIVRDINPGGERRWTLDHPELKFTVVPRPNLRFTIDFAVAEQTFRDTGPVTVVVKINTHKLGQIRCELPGDYHFERLVPLEWLELGKPTHVVAEARPLWTAPSDGARLGYLIQQAGFM